MARKKSEKAEIIGNLDPKHWVQKSDPLVLMRSVPFSLGELKILDTYISRINAADDSRMTVIFTKEEYEKLMGISKVNLEYLKKNTKGLLGKIVTLEMPDKSFFEFVLFTAAYYHLDDCGVPVIELSCSPQAKDLFFCIGKYHYFKYALENVINLTRKASYLLYIYILPNRYRGKWEIDLIELRDRVLDCKEQESYQEYKIFKNRVLDPAVKEVNAKTDCHFEYETVKRGRRVAKIKFIYKSIIPSESVPEPQLEGQTTLFDVDVASTSERPAELSSGVLSGFDVDEAKLLRSLAEDVCKYGGDVDEYIRQKSEITNFYAKKNTNGVRSRFGYMRKLMNDDLKEIAKMEASNKQETSYDLDEWERRAMAFDPTTLIAETFGEDEDT